MNYFTTKRTFFLVPSYKCDEKFEKINKYLSILEKSGIGDIIEQERKYSKKSKVGRKEYNSFNLMATIIYCFAMHKGSLREIEDLCRYDLRVIYLMEQETPSYKSICDFINRYIVPYTYEIFSKVTMIMGLLEINYLISNSPFWYLIYIFFTFILFFSSLSIFLISYFNS